MQTRPAREAPSSPAMRRRLRSDRASHRRSIRALPQVRLPLARLVQLFLDAPPRAQVRLGERMRDQEALRLLAPVRLEEVELRGRLDALRDAAKAERMRQ